MIRWHDLSLFAGVFHLASARQALLAHGRRRAYVDHTVISPLIVTIAAAVIVLVAIVALTTRRLRAHSEFELGSVSQQWLLGHKDGADG